MCVKNLKKLYKIDLLRAVVHIHATWPIVSSVTNNDNDLRDINFFFCKNKSKNFMTLVKKVHWPHPMNFIIKK